jgi:hypothetical protein
MPAFTAHYSGADRAEQLVRAFEVRLKQAKHTVLVFDHYPHVIPRAPGDVL